MPPDLSAEIVPDAAIAKTYVGVREIGKGFWTLLPQIASMPPEHSPTSFGAGQIKAFIAA